MIACTKCRKPIEPGDDYVLDGCTRICCNCIEQHIFDQYDIFDLCRELGMSVREAPEEKPVDVDGPLKGQMDMFGGVVE